MKNNFYLQELIRLFGPTAVAKMIFLPIEKKYNG